MSILEDAFHTVFGDSGDAVDEAGDAQQARIVQAIDLINANISKIDRVLEGGRKEFVDLIRETTTRMKSEIQGGNAQAADELRAGLQDQTERLVKTFDLSFDTLVNGFAIIENNLSDAEIEATNELIGFKDAARADVTQGRDSALSTLRTSLTDSLNAISQGEDKASTAIRESLARTRENFAPFIAAGQTSIERASELANDPNAQRDFIENNPFFSALQEEARRDLFGNQAARGRLGTGETLEELDKRTLLLGENLVGNRINQLLNVSGQGLNASSNSSSAEISGANLLSQLFQGGANARVNANTNFGNNSAAIETDTGNRLGGFEFSTGQSAADITTGLSELLAQIGSNFTGTQANNILNLGLAGANDSGNTSAALAQLFSGEGNTLAGITGQQGFSEADAATRLSSALATNLGTGTDAVSNLLLMLGNSEAGEVIGEQNAQTQGFNTLLQLGSAIAGMSGLGNIFGGGGSGGGVSHGFNTNFDFKPFNPVPFTPFEFGT